MSYRTKPGWLLPDDIDPEETLCIPITIPNTPEYRWAFWACLETLGWYTAWEKDDLKRGKDAAAVWQNYIEQAKALVGECDSPMAYTLNFDGCNIQLMLGDVVASEVALSADNCPSLVGPPGADGPAGPAGPTGPAGPAGEPGSGGNQYPPPPTSNEGNALCGAAHRVADEIIDLAISNWQDSSVFTFDEAINALFAERTGWESSYLAQVLRWLRDEQLIDLDTRIEALRTALRTHLYCSELDTSEAAVDAALLAESSDVDAVWAVVQTVLSVPGQIHAWIFLGSEDPSTDCALYDCGGWCVEIDLTQDPGPFALPFPAPEDKGQWVDGIGWTTTVRGSNNGQALYAVTNNITGTAITGIEADVDVNQNYNMAFPDWNSPNWDPHVAIHSQVIQDGQHTIVWNGDYTMVGGLGLHFINSAVNQSATYTRVKITGTGVNPWPAYECVD